MANANTKKPDYGIDAPNVLRNLLLIGFVLLMLGAFGPPHLHFGQVDLLLRPMFLGTGALLVVEGLLFLFYVKVGKFHHRDQMLSLYTWQGDEAVLDVGCGRGLLMAGAAKRLNALHGKGTVTGIDIWSNEDMGGNEPGRSRRKLRNSTWACTR